MTRFINPIHAESNYEVDASGYTMFPHGTFRDTVHTRSVKAVSELSIKAPPVNTAAPLFNNASTYMDFGNIAPIPDSGDWTVEFWIYPTEDFDDKWNRIFVQGTSSSTYQTVVLFYYGDLVVCRGTTHADFQVYTNPTHRKWTHIAIVYDSTTGDYWIAQNGIWWGWYSYDIDWAFSTMGFLMGAASDTTNFSGCALSEFRVWNKIKIDTDIKNQMYTRLTGSEPNLTAYWRLDDRSTTITDSGPNNYHGTAYNEIGWFPPR